MKKKKQDENVSMIFECRYPLGASLYRINKNGFKELISTTDKNIQFKYDRLKDLRSIGDKTYKKTSGIIE